VLCNHTQALDPIFLSLSFPEPLYYVATKEIFNLGLLSKLLVNIFAPIPKTKSYIDISTLKNIFTVKKEGGSIALYPEGNITYNGTTNYVPNLGKLVKAINLPVIVFNTHGLYLSNPRWSINRKKGKSSGDIRKILSIDDINNTETETLTKELNELLFVDANFDALAEHITFTGSGISNGFERLMYICPKCGEVLSIKTYGKHVFCKECDYLVEYDGFGYVGHKPIKDINKKVIIDTFNYIKKSGDNDYFTDSFNLFLSNDIKKEKMGTMNLRVNKEGLFITSIDSDFVIDAQYDNIKSLSIQGKNKIILIVNDAKYLMVFEPTISVYKYLIVYQIITKGGLTNDTIDFSNIGL
jgi:hypothetical protein